jgi:hypothetical protein
MRLLAPALSLDIEPTLDLVKKALADIGTAKHDPFLILAQNKTNYVQAIFTHEGYILINQSGSSEERLRTKDPVNGETAVKAFEGYFQGDESWNEGIEFEAMNAPKPTIFKLGYLAGKMVEKIGKLFNQTL